jgi:hypothetical protein
MDPEHEIQASSPLQQQIDAFVEAVNDDDLLEVLAGLRSLGREQLDIPRECW